MNTVFTPELLIFSQEDDLATTQVLQWLLKAGTSFFRINEEDAAYVEQLSPAAPQDAIINIRHKQVSLRHVKSIWYRRGKLNLSQAWQLLDSPHPGFSQQLQETRMLEVERLQEYISSLLAPLPGVTGYLERHINKLQVLEQALAHGLQVPDTLVTSSLTELRGFAQKHGNIITKALDQTLIFKQSNQEKIGFYTTLITKELMAQLPDQFFPSVFQQYVAKAYEVRAFYLRGEFYSMAIFSQESAHTMTDFRSVADAPNRSVPFELPQAMAERLHALMQALQLQTGSIDLIVTPELEFYFLEVNPTGQFGMTSAPCNYYLEEAFAQAISQDLQTNPT